MRTREILVRIFKGYNHIFRRKFLDEANSAITPLQQWQANFFSDIMYFLIPLSYFVYAPSLLMCLKDSLYILVFVDTFVFVSIQFAFFNTRMRLLYRKAILLIAFFLLGIGLIWSMGWIGPGLFYLMAYSVFTTLIINRKIGIVTWILNIFVFVILAVLLHFRLLDEELFSDLYPVKLFIISLNFILLNLVLVVTSSSLMKSLQTKIESEMEIIEKLKEETKLHKAARDRAEESDKLKSAFLANMSHEIRTPMNSILGFAELLRKRELSDARQKDYLRIIEESGKRMLNILNDLMDISKIEAGLIGVRNDIININEQLMSLQEQMTIEAEGRGISLSLSDGLPSERAFVRTDGEKLYAVLLNLVKNAIKFTENGKIEFGYSLGNREGSPELLFYVQDTGIGIPKIMQTMIFNRFVQADIEDKHARQGAGLGLYISKSYVEMLGGRIWVESVEQEGSVFYFTIPYLAVDPE